MIDLDKPDILPSHQQLVEAAQGLASKTWAESVLAAWQREMGQPAVRSWVFQLGLLAANSLGRAARFIPLYEQYLRATDAQTKPDWHAELTEKARSQNMLAQSGRLGQDTQSFDHEFKSIVTALGLPGLGPILDVGCAGGAYSINLARFGFQVFGTDHHSGIIEAARENAAAAGVSDKTSFAVDDACASLIPDGSYSRAICISVTPCLPNDAAFESLISHLDRVTRPEKGENADRRVILGHNRWGPSRTSALQGILADDPSDQARAVNRLNLLQVTWWLQPSHLDVIKRYFSVVTEFGKTSSAVDGDRIDLLLQ